MAPTCAESSEAERELCPSKCGLALKYIYNIHSSTKGHHYMCGEPQYNPQVAMGLDLTPKRSEAGLRALP